MAQNNPVNAWDSRLALIPESTLGTTPAPASEAAAAAFYRRYISCDLGPAEVGNVRASKDRAIGRGMTSEFIEGRVQPGPWSVDMAVRGRSAIDVTALESTLYKGAGLKETLTGATSATYGLSPTPLASGYFSSFSLYRISGEGAATYEAETARGCVVEQLQWSGGDSEVLLKATGKWLGKYIQGSVESVTLVDGSGTTLTLGSAADSYRVGLGYYKIESEIILVTATTAGNTAVTIARAQLGSTGAAHSGKQMIPYMPLSLISYSGSPLAETTATVTIDGIATPCTKWSTTYSTGMSHYPGETGSKYVQGVKETRYDVKHHVELLLRGDRVDLLRKATARPTVIVSITQGTGTGGIFTVASSYCEVVAFKVPDTVNDVAVASIDFRVRESAGADQLLVTLT